jgi:hypothetical protein
MRSSDQVHALHVPFLAFPPFLTVHVERQVVLRVASNPPGLTGTERE